MPKRLPPRYRKLLCAECCARCDARDRRFTGRDEFRATVDRVVDWAQQPERGEFALAQALAAVGVPVGSDERGLMIACGSALRFSGFAARREYTGKKRVRIFHWKE